MNFKYNYDTYIIEGDDRDVFVQVAGKSRKQGTFFVLNINDKRVGFATSSFWNNDLSEIGDDGTVTWRVKEVGCALYKDHEYLGGGIDADIEPYRFEDEAEQSKIFDVFDSALQTYPGIPDTSKLGVEPLFIENHKNSSFEYSPGVSRLIKQGAFLKSATRFKFNPETKLIECDDPALFVEVVGFSRETGMQFMLNLDGKRFGFVEAETNDEDRERDKTCDPKIFRIGYICHTVLGVGEFWSGSGLKFESEEQQSKAMELFSEAILSFGGKGSHISIENTLYARDQGVGLVEYTDEVLNKAANGEYLEN